VRHGAPQKRTVTAFTRGAKNCDPARRSPALLTDEIALVKAIRRAYGSPEGYGGLEAFHVADIFDFARRLHREGVRAHPRLRE